MVDFASTLNSIEKLNEATMNHGVRECNITFLAKKKGMSPVDQTPHHQQMLKQQKGGRPKLEMPCVFSR
ncbi:hypothetical protein H5410_050067 [Solanum commersonii]|uniref:Uncharacterized protein n=1 Tax=Solanum commersonii TaxID=4109 RepID=A0A9J5WWT0_SOLCO|nr:hypothetical protein H5410_050067 [Solanum commersonii]